MMDSIVAGSFDQPLPLWGILDSVGEYVLLLSYIVEVIATHYLCNFGEESTETEQFSGVFVDDTSIFA